MNKITLTKKHASSLRTGPTVLKGSAQKTQLIEKDRQQTQKYKMDNRERLREGNRKRFSSEEGFNRWADYLLNYRIINGSQLDFPAEIQSAGFGSEVIKGGGKAVMRALPRGFRFNPSFDGPILITPPVLRDVFRNRAYPASFRDLTADQINQYTFGRAHNDEEYKDGEGTLADFIRNGGNVEDPEIAPFMELFEAGSNQTETESIADIYNKMAKDAAKYPLPEDDAEPKEKPKPVPVAPVAPAPVADAPVAPAPVAAPVAAPAPAPVNGVPNMPPVRLKPPVKPPAARTRADPNGDPPPPREITRYRDPGFKTRRVIPPVPVPLPKDPKDQPPTPQEPKKDPPEDKPDEPVDGADAQTVDDHKLVAGEGYGYIRPEFSTDMGLETMILSNKETMFELNQWDKFDEVTDAIYTLDNPLYLRQLERDNFRYSGIARDPNFYLLKEYNNYNHPDDFKIYPTQGTRHSSNNLETALGQVRRDAFNIAGPQNRGLAFRSDPSYENDIIERIYENPDLEALIEYEVNYINNNNDIALLEKAFKSSVNISQRWTTEISDYIDKL